MDEKSRQRTGLVAVIGDEVSPSCVHACEVLRCRHFHASFSNVGVVVHNKADIYNCIRYTCTFAFTNVFVLFVCLSTCVCACVCLCVCHDPILPSPPPLSHCDPHCVGHLHTTIYCYHNNRILSLVFFLLVLANVTVKTVIFLS
jgi:hypothetical protein